MNSFSNIFCEFGKCPRKSFLQKTSRRLPRYIISFASYSDSRNCHKLVNYLMLWERIKSKTLKIARIVNIMNLKKFRKLISFLKLKYQICFFMFSSFLQSYFIYIFIYLFVLLFYICTFDYQHQSVQPCDRGKNIICIRIFCLLN